MAVAHEELREEAKTRNNESPRPTPDPVEPPNVSMKQKDKTHISNEMLLAAGGTVAGAAFLGGALGGAVGAVVGAVAGLGVALFSSKSRLKEGARRS
jgi:hypothetical protein